MGQWCFGINLPLRVDEVSLFLFAGGLGAVATGIAKLQRLDADEKLTADVDVLVTEVHDGFRRQVVGEGTGIHLDEAWVGGKEQISRFHNLLNTRCGSLAVVGAKEKAIAFRKHALAG